MLAKDLAEAFAEQAFQFPHDVHLGEHVKDLVRTDDHLVVRTDRAEYPTRTLLIAAGAAEAAIAVNNAVHLIDPTAKVNPGHSTSYKIFDHGPGGASDEEG